MGQRVFSSISEHLGKLAKTFDPLFTINWFPYKLDGTVHPSFTECIEIPKQTMSGKETSLPVLLTYIHVL